jgi:type II secretory pathway component PulK
MKGIHHASKSTSDARRGAALISALSMLVLLSMLGTAYVSYMLLEQDEARMSVQNVRARYLADGGIQAAIGEIQAAIEDGRVPQTQYSFDLPLYMNNGGTLEPDSQQVSVQVTDESALININHVERAVLEALGIPRNVARDIRNQLPRAEIPSMERRTWFSSVEDLRTRGYLDGKEFRNTQTDLMTVHTVADPDNARNFININSAPAGVLAALFNLTNDQALAVVEKRPFRSWDDVVRKVGTDPSTYNVVANAEPNRAMPVELALTSRCFRLVSEANMVNALTSRRGLTKRVEAVVIVNDDGTYTYRLWTETPAELTEIHMAEGTGEEGTLDATDIDESGTEGADTEGAPAEGETDESAPSEPVDDSAQAVSIQ